jgi:arylsulfatase B
MPLSRRQFLASAAAPLAAASRRPNIVFIVADDLGYGELGAQGNPEIPTPHIDSIAQSGVRFTQGYVSAPFCSPSRAGFITGRYQTRFGHELNVTGKQNLLLKNALPLSESTMADSFQAAGYRTAAIGKWHLGGAGEFHPLARGFHEFYGFLHEGHFYRPRDNKTIVSRLRPNEPPYDDDNPIFRGRDAIVEPEYFTSAIAREACAFIGRQRRQPFFLYLPFNAIHSPMQADPPDLARFAHIQDPHRRIFAAMLASFDDAVGRILAQLKRHGLERDTLVAFISDNGGPTAELTSSNKPLRGGKGQLFEGGIRVPFFLKYPRVIQPGRTMEAPVSALDLFPTFLAAAQSKPPGQPLDGLNLLPWFAPNPTIPPERPIFWRHGRASALRQGDWKVVRQFPPNQPIGPWELYNLRKDPAEAYDLAPAEPDRVSALAAIYENFNRQMIPPTPRT